MLKDTDIVYVKADDGIKGVPLVWVIDGDCLYDIPTWQEYADMFINADEIVDISEDYQDHDGITVRFVKEGVTLDELQTTEYFGSILLSNPLVVNMLDYPYAQYVTSPHATFDGEKFTVTDGRDMTGFLKWHPHHPRAAEND